MTIKRLATFFSTLLVLIGITAQAQTKEMDPSVSKPQNALLWEISGKGLSKPSYLYGTIHMIPKADFFLTDATKKALGESQKVIFEINMKDMQNPMMLIGIMSKAMMPRGQKLRDLISKEDYALVKARFDEIGMPLPMLESIKPMFLSAMIEGGGDNPSDTTGKGATTMAYEVEIMKIAEKDKKEMGGLETMEFQMGIFDSIPLKAQAEMLVKSIKSVNKGDSEFKAMVDMYKSQDIEAMAGTMKGGEENEMAKYEGILLTNRNKNWIPLIAKNSAGKSIFYAVGAGHLGGEMGVINLLRKEGFTVKALK
jgi:uncharacterized protein